MQEAETVTPIPPGTEDNPFSLPAVDSKSLNGGRGVRFAFENRYGASVVRHSFSYGGRDGFWELAVLRDVDLVGPGRIWEWDLCYSTSITDDVIGHMTEAHVNETLRKIGAL